MAMNVADEDSLIMDSANSVAARSMSALPQ